MGLEMMATAPDKGLIQQWCGIPTPMLMKQSEPLLLTWRAVFADGWRLPRLIPLLQLQKRQLRMAFQQLAGSLWLCLKPALQFLNPAQEMPTLDGEPRATP